MPLIRASHKAGKGLELGLRFPLSSGGGRMPSGRALVDLTPGSLQRRRPKGLVRNYSVKFSENITCASACKAEDYEMEEDGGKERKGGNMTCLQMRGW